MDTWFLLARAVAATDQRDKKASFSNYGNNVDVSAPGVNIRSSIGGGNYQYYNGTSMAAPHVAGLAALIWSVNPSLTNAQVRKTIEDNCDNIDSLNPTYAGKLGKGRINAHKALLNTKGFGNMNAIKICSGKTLEGNTDWKAYGTTGIYVDVDTSECGFDTTPIYIVNIHGNSKNWRTTGGSTAYNRTRNGFRVYVRFDDGGELTPDYANQRMWHIQWIASGK